MRKQSSLVAVRLFCLALGLFATAATLASCPVDVLPFAPDLGTEVTPCPGVNHEYGRMVYIIRGADIAATGLASGTPVTAIGWAFLSGYTPGWPATAPLKIYLQNTNDYTNMKSTDWATAIGGMTLVHDATTTIPSGAGPFEIAFAGGSPFTYTGGGLYVAFDWGPYQGTLDAAVGTVLTTASDQQGDVAFAYSDSAAPTTLDTSPSRLATRLWVGSPTADAGVSALYTLGSLPLNEAVGRTFQAYLVNNGAADLANLPVTLTISGASTSFTDTHTLPSLPQCTSATVTFAPFTPGVTDACTATVSVPADGNTANNSLSHPLAITPDTCSYKYPGPTPAQGLGGAIPVEIDARFASQSATEVNSVMVEFARASAATYRICVRGDDGTGKPGSVLYMDANDRTIGAAGSETVPLASIVNVGPGNFFIGVVQTNSTNMTLAFDYENPIRAGTFYINRGLQGIFADFSPGLPYKPNIGAILGCFAITVDPATLPSVAIATPYSQTISASGAPGPYTFAVTAGSLPGGLTLDGMTGVLSGTPTASGDFTFTVTATDASTCTGHEVYSITVTCPTITVSPATLPGGTAGVAYSSTTFTQTGGVGTITWSESGLLPTGMTFNAATATLSGTPTQTGSFPITVTATDSNTCTGSQSYTLKIACPTITVGPPSLPSGTAGAAYPSTPFTQTGGVGTITWSESGLLPTGITFNAATATLSGTPTQTGSFPITVTATDSNNCTGSMAYSLTIICPTITLNPSTLPKGTVGAAYSQAITALISVPALRHEAAVLAFSVTAGALPAGLGLSAAGVLSGVPSAAGAYAFTVTATDAYGCTGSQQYTVNIAAYDMSFQDDLGRSRVCVNSKTGDWQFTVLSGAGRGVYMGKGSLSKTTDRWTFRSLAGSPRLMLVTYYPQMSMANGSFGGSDFTSQLSDRNTKDDPFICAAN